MTNTRNQPSAANIPKRLERLADDRIPLRLQDIPQPPKHLWLEGNLPEGGTKFLCVVGSRKHSEYGREACRELILGLKGYNVCIVSGLGLGIDSIAHEAALEAGLRTMAFPGSGLDRSVLHPASLRELAGRIVEAGGGLLSEFDPDQHADIWTCAQRGRLMAGMSHATLVVEAETDSGALLAAGYAQECGRAVLCVPGSIFSPLAHGPNKFIQMGAGIVRSTDDILHGLDIDRRQDGGKPLIPA